MMSGICILCSSVFNYFDGRHEKTTNKAIDEEGKGSNEIEKLHIGSGQEASVEKKSSAVLIGVDTDGRSPRLQAKMK